MDEKKPNDPGDFHRRVSEERLRDPEFRAEYERVYTEMLGQLAPATEGPVVNPGRKRRGRLVLATTPASLADSPAAPELRASR